MYIPVHYKCKDERTWCLTYCCACVKVEVNCSIAFNGAKNVAPAWLGVSVAAQIAAWSPLEWLGGSRGARVACCSSWWRRIPRPGIGIVFLRVTLILTSSFLFSFSLPSATPSRHAIRFSSSSSLFPHPVRTRFWQRFSLQLRFFLVFPPTGSMFPVA